MGEFASPSEVPSVALMIDMMLRVIRFQLEHFQACAEDTIVLG